MKIPKNINQFTIATDRYGLFPPIGYLTIEETSNGGGDYMGLYWEIGKENKDPIVCSSQHESCSLVPECKDFESFVEWFNETNGQGSPAAPIDDNDYFMSLTLRGKVLTKNGKNEEAIQKLERAVSLFGEYSETWYLLSENYYITGQKEKGDRAILNSISSNYFFVLPSKKAIDRFNEMIPSKELENHPIVKRKTNLIKGGDFTTPFSINYYLLLEAIEELTAINDHRTALLMKQNYGLLMSSETKEIAQKHGFIADAWLKNFQHELLSIYPERKY